MTNLPVSSTGALKGFISSGNALLSSLLLFIVRLYRFHLSGWMGGACRFHPSCSVYAEGCLNRFSAPTATYLILKRLLRCRPLGPYGLDPVPERNLNNGRKTA